MTTQPTAAADSAAADAPSTFPALRLKNGEDRRLSAGHLWVFSNEVDTAATPLNNFAKGAICRVVSSRDKFLGYRLRQSEFADLGADHGTRPALSARADRCSCIACRWH